MKTSRDAKFAAFVFLTTGVHFSVNHYVIWGTLFLGIFVIIMYDSMSPPTPTDKE